MNYDIIVIGSGPGGIFSAYELSLQSYTNVREFGGIIDWEYETVK